MSANHTEQVPILTITMRHQELRWHLPQAESTAALRRRTSRGSEIV